MRINARTALFFALGAIVCAGIVSALLFRPFLPVSAVAECQSAPRKDTCYNDVINKVFRERGLAAAFDTLAAAYDADPSYLATCHAETHELGKAAYDVFHETGTVELTSKASYCGYGFYHGFMEELIYKTNNFDEARQFCAYAGSVIPTPLGYAEGACYHGIGHGVTDGTDPRLWGSAQKIAAPGLALCAKVAEGDRDHHYRCDSGVFNSVALLYHKQKYTLDADKDAFSLCNVPSYTGVEKEACYDQMNTLAMYLAGRDFTTAIRSVRTIAEAKYRTIAIKGITAAYFSNARSRHLPFSAREVSDACASTGTDSNGCITGVIGGIQEFGTPGAEYTDMFALCESPDLDTRFSATCFSGIIDSTDLFYDDDVVRTVCNKIPSRYRTAACFI